MNTGAARVAARRRLAQAGFTEAEREANLLAAYLADVPPGQLALHLEAAVEEARLDSLLAQRLTGRPLQYVLGEAGFMGLGFQVGPDVLIPRADTEIIAEKAMALAQGLPAPLIADIGAGCGALAVSLAYHLPQAQAHAVDISPAALIYAEKNARLNGVAARCHFYPGDLVAPLMARGLRFDIIVSNPPYISRAEMENLPAEVKWEPFMALCGGEDGLDFYRRLAQEAAPLLKPQGWLLLEHGWQQQEHVAAILKRAGWQIKERLNDYGGRARGLLCSPSVEL
ncbi:MAG: peptide chain release factor N(5)-glutamine methyltransferase [Clostridiales bacterium]|nr:peptide chain release factor N(5)-glutamine methyltransferase [Clostridiales bacterium]